MQGGKREEGGGVQRELQAERTTGSTKIHQLCTLSYSEEEQSVTPAARRVGEVGGGGMGSGEGCRGGGRGGQVRAAEGLGLKGDNVFFPSRSESSKSSYCSFRLLYTKTLGKSGSHSFDIL